MASEVRQTVEDIFQAVCELAPAQRSAHLDRACADDQELRREIEELLKFYDAGETFLEKPALQDAARQLANRLSNSDDQSETGADTLREGDWMLGPYRILDQLGKGGMGVVYLAEDTRDGKQVAIKVLPKEVDLDQDRLARFSREGRMLEELKQLKHPNIAEIYEQAEYDGKPCLVLEYVPGDTLSDRLRSGPLPTSEALQYALQIADALKSAHARRIVHRDLKPANIKITREGRVKVLDFGLAKRFQAECGDEDASEQRTRSLSLTESGMLIGTPAYMSPEQWEGKQIDQRTDIWAFGCLIYEMLAGKQPFARETRAQTMKSVFDASPDWQALPKQTPLVVQELLLRCFQRDVSQRLQNAADARRAVARAISENKFALVLYLKTWFWKIDRRTKIAFAATALALVAVLVWQYTPVGDWLPLPDNRIAISDENDLAVILPKAIEGITSDLVRAALLPDKQSSDDLLQNGQWKALLDKPDNKQAIEDVINALKRMIERKGETAQRYAILAQAHLFKFYLTKEAGDKDEALQAVQKAQSLNAENPATLIAQGNVLISVGKLKDAAAVFEQARRQYPDEPDVMLGLAMAHDFSGDEENRAEELYKAAIDVRQRREGNKYWGDLNDLGWYYFERGSYQQAADCWREVIRLNPFSPNGYINLGNALLYLGCFNDAAGKYRDSITNGGETVEAYVNLGAVYYYLGNYTEAINYLSRITGNNEAREDVNLIEAWGNLGDSCWQSGQHNEAADAYHIALELINKQLIQFRGDYQIKALKAEIIAKLNSLSQNTGQDDPVGLTEKNLSLAPDCLECLASAVTVYHLVKRDNDALQMAVKAVKEGYSPFLLISLPELAELRSRVEFRRIQQIAQSERGKCEAN
jgi:serine/threonine protein kinase/Flp pilus assembly protein TadD